MRSINLTILFTAMLALAGIPACADPVHGASGLRERPEKKDVSLALIYKEAYTDKRWIGVAPKGQSVCQKVAGWRSEKLTQYPPRVPPSSDALLKKLGLDRICIYTPEKGASLAFTPPKGYKVQKDRLAVATTSAGGLPSDPLGTRIWERLATLTTDHTGQVLTDPGNPDVRKTFHFSQQPGVRLTFLDSQPDSRLSPEGAFAKPGEGDSVHGFTLAHLARNIVCPPGPGGARTCAATIESRRALGYGNFDTSQPFPPKELEEQKSGQVGLVSDLAGAIVAEVLDWQIREPHKHLILNLSLGWDGEGFGDLGVHSVRKLDPAVQAVYDAIRFARLSGALVIAAAGNRRGGSQDTEWPLLPAAWELRRPSWFPLPLGRKPLYAVGGVDWQNLPLSNSRDGGRPRRAAYADHSVTYAEALDGPTAMYTGTSVSAAVTSSIAAVIWHLRPDLGPAQVMKLLARSGEPLGFRADYYAWKHIWPLSKLIPAPRATKLSLCKAVERACGSQGSACEGRVEPFAACGPMDPPQPPGLGPLNEFAAFPKPATLATPGTKNESLDLGSQRWLYPQPEATPCPGCVVVVKDPPSSGQTTATSTEYELAYSIGDQWRTEACNDALVLKSGLLEITCGGTSYPPQSLPQDALDPLPTVAQKISLPDLGTQFSSCSFKLTFEVEKGSDPDLIPVENPVLIDPKLKS